MPLWTAVVEIAYAQCLFFAKKSWREIGRKKVGHHTEGTSESLMVSRLSMEYSNDVEINSWKEGRH